MEAAHCQPLGIQGLRFPLYFQGTLWKAPGFGNFLSQCHSCPYPLLPSAVPWEQFI